MIEKHVAVIALHWRCRFMPAWCSSLIPPHSEGALWGWHLYWLWRSFEYSEIIIVTKELNYMSFMTWQVIPLKDGWSDGMFSNNASQTITPQPPAGSLKPGWIHAFRIFFFLPSNFDPIIKKFLQKLMLLRQNNICWSTLNHAGLDRVVLCTQKNI